MKDFLVFPAWRNGIRSGHFLLCVSLHFCVLIYEYSNTIISNYEPCPNDCQTVVHLLIISNSEPCPNDCETVVHLLTYRINL